MGKPYAWASLQLSDRELKEGEAVYESESKEEQVVAFEEGRLVIFPAKGLKSQLIPFAKDSFHIENSLTTVLFNRGENGKIESFTLQSTEKPITWLRTQKEVKTLKAIKVAPKTLDQYVGKYQIGSDYFMIIKEDNKLYGKAPGNNQIRQEILPYDKHKFFAKNLDAQIIFDADEKGKVIGLTLIQNGEKKAPKVD